MTIEEAARLLREMHRDAPQGAKYASVHLFGIKHAEALKGMPLGEIAQRAGLTKAYGTEIRKGDPRRALCGS
jgi:hypothetical protein